jgi:serine/threonine-protein kinase
VDRKLINRRYRMERKIGEGAAAEVFLAHDSVLNRKVALKSLRPQFAADPGFRVRFEREAQAAARFNHPNIIAIFDVGEDRGLPYIVMEYVDGDTLRTIIDQEAPIHADDVAILVEQVAAGLDYAHQRGLVHRDIKPHNILVDHQGLAKVVDFGIAKGLNDEALTDAAEGIGTVQYISPEQASGLMATPESDIYSLAVVAFEMLTGQLPFDSETAIGIAMRHVNDPAPDPAEIDPNIPHEVADIILRALSKDPTHRFPTAGEFARVLTAWRSYTPEDWKAARVRASTGSFPRQIPTPPAFSATPTSHPQTTAYSRPTEPIPQTQPAATATRPIVERRITEEPVALPADEEPPYVVPRVERERRSGVGSWIASALVLAVVALLLWFGLGLGDRLTGGSSNDRTPTAQAQVTATTAATTADINVPSVIGKTEADARAALSAKGLTAIIAGTVASDTIAKGAVVSQDPTTGQALKAGDAVHLTMSSGPAPVDLGAMNLVGMKAADAQSQLETKGFKVVPIEQASKTIAEGAVISVSPPDQAQPGATVTLAISVGDKVQIPVSLQGENVETVKASLEELGLKIAGTNALAAGDIKDGNGQPLDLNALGIVNGDVVGIQDNGAVFGGWVAPGTSVTLNYYDANAEQPTVAPAA